MAFRRRTEGPGEKDTTRDRIIVGDVQDEFTILIGNEDTEARSRKLGDGLIGRIADFGGQVSGATLRLGDGLAVLLGSSAVKGFLPRLTVRRLDDEHVELGVGEDEPVTTPGVGGLHGLFVMLKLDQLEKGGLDLLPPASAEDWKAEMDAKFAAAATSAARLRPFVERACATGEASRASAASTAFG